MGPDVVVLAEPLVDDDLGLPGGGEPFSIQDFPAKGSIEAFVIAIFPCAARQASEATPRGDFVHDRLSNGRPYKMLTVLDEYTREALSVTVATKMGSAEVLDALYPLLINRGKPEYVRSDNGPEFTSSPFKEWLVRVGVQPIHIYPGSPWENGYNERFNGTLRREVLNAEWFTTSRQAQVVINQWLRQYNHIRPHHALGMRPPVPKTILVNGQTTGTEQGG